VLKLTKTGGIDLLCDARSDAFSTKRKSFRYPGEACMRQRFALRFNLLDIQISCTSAEQVLCNDAKEF
jgi:hypothetical protein